MENESPTLKVAEPKLEWVDAIERKPFEQITPEDVAKLIRLGRGMTATVAFLLDLCKDGGVNSQDALMLWSFCYDDYHRALKGEV